MPKIILIDDEPLARSVVKHFLTAHPEFEIVAECSNGFEGVKAIELHAPDLIFLDVQMPKINGFEMLELIDESPAVIFTTAFDEYALKAFEAAAVDYLLKPFSQDRFDQSIERWKQLKHSVAKTSLDHVPHKQPDEQQRIVIKDGASITILPTEQVHIIEAYDDYVKIHSLGKIYVKKKTMKYYEDVLDPRQFIRIHRSFIINLNYLTGIEPFEKNSYRAILKDGKRLSISRTAYAPLKESLGL